MTVKIKNLKPQKLWNIFSEICAIPHPSGHETALCDFLFEMENGFVLKVLALEQTTVLVLPQLWQLCLTVILNMVP